MTEDNSQVEYRPIPGFSGYRAGTDGTIWTQRQRGPGGHLRSAWWPLKLKPDGHGYLSVTLSRNGKKTAKLVHHLILETFVGPKPEGMQACHAPDRNPGNNSLANLRWGTRAENDLDREIQGTIQRGSKASGAKLNETQVLEIRRLHDAGHGASEIAKQFGVSQSTVSMITHRRNWRHLEGGETKGGGR